MRTALNKLFGYIKRESWTHSDSNSDMFRTTIVNLMVHYDVWVIKRDKYDKILIRWNIFQKHKQDLFLWNFCFTYGVSALCYFWTVTFLQLEECPIIFISFLEWSVRYLIFNANESNNTNSSKVHLKRVRRTFHLIGPS